MLVLKRKQNEIIKIGDDIEVVIADIKGNRVRLGVRAPKEVKVRRRELIHDASHPRAPTL